MDFASSEFSPSPEQQRIHPVSQQPNQAVKESQDPQINSGRTGGTGVSLGWFVSVRAFLLIVIILQLVLVYFFFQPPFLAQQNFNQQIIDEVSKLTVVNPFENPIVTRVANSEALKAENDIQAQVYKDAQDGDYVIGFSDKIIIYRRESGQIVYEGESPGAIVSRNQENFNQTITKAVKDLGIIKSESVSTPQLRVVNDVASLQQTNPDFYSGVQQGDVIAIFSTEGVIVIYRPSSNSIVKTGSFETQISSL